MRSVALFGGVLLITMSLSWMHYTEGEEKPRVGTVLFDGKKTDLQKAVYQSPDLTVEYEVRSDGLGSYGWVTVTENKKKKTPNPDKPGEFTETSEKKVTKFKAGSAADKLVDGLAPLMAVRSLDDVPADKLEAFGLTAPDTTLAVTLDGTERTLSLGGETYGTKDRYVKDTASGHIYVVDDEVFKSLKFAATRLPERSLTDLKPEEIVSASLGQGASTVSWTHKNTSDKAAAYWSRDGGGAPVVPEAAPASPDAPADAAAEAPTSDKDVTFANWVDSALKLKSTAYVQDGAEPATLVAAFDLTLRAEGKPEQTIHVLRDGDDWYARGEFVRGLVKLSKGPAEDATSDVDDILEGRVPPEKAKPAKPPPALTKPPGGDKPPKGPPGAPGSKPIRPPGAPSITPRPG